MNETVSHHDVLVMGGGLAGLTLALQLKRADPAIDVAVLERRAHPVPHAAHKVGESSVEIGAHYFDTVLGLKEHMQTAQLRKFGFRFFFSEGRRDIDRVTEIGASRHLSVPSYQIDRGIFENFLAEEAQRLGVRFVDAALVRQVDLAQEGGEPHRVSWTRHGERHAAQARWIVDACGRAGLIKRKLGLEQPNAHDANAVWFRIQDRLVIDDWVDNNAAWRNRCDPPARWLSTNHLVGEGYWVWLIPLASGSHSVGIVADEAIHPLSTMDSFDKAMDWIAKYQPRLHDELQSRRRLLQDFAFFRRFSYGCKQVFSGAQRWALTGEAGLFLDPFYSPGNDFIAIANTYITDLVSRDRAGQRIAARAQIYDETYQSFYESTLALYTGQYAIFGNPEVLPAKVIWDYTYYWGVLAQLFFDGRLTDLSMLAKLRPELMRAQQLNLDVQATLRAWSAASSGRSSNRPVMHDQAALPWFAALNKSLNERCNDAQFVQRIRASVARLDALAAEISGRARAAGAVAQGLAADAAVPCADRMLFDAGAYDALSRLAAAA